MDVDELLFKEPEKTIKCTECGALYKGKGQTWYWETYNDKFNGLCHDCYVKKLNENFTEEDARYFAEKAFDEAIRFNFTAGYRHNSDVNINNWEKIVLPMIDIIIEERQQAKENEYFQQKINEATAIYENSYKLLGEYKYVSYGDIRNINIIAILLKKIDELEKKIPQEDIMNKRFTI